jgi:alkanesulfonate monooxygenase SsuD/methylene tetrahydromethanopterin reductase-like flavin-dependent oxidoreductase (luciferase family)
MKVGFFMQPVHPPNTPVFEGIAQDLDEIEFLDSLGVDEAWFGEHLTAKTEPWPAGDLIISQAIPRTKNIKLCSGGYIPQFYHPAALAFRIMQLDHMAQGRYMCGIAAGTVFGDFKLMNVDNLSGQHREMQAEAIEIMKRIWTEHLDGEWEFKGKFWHVRNPGHGVLMGDDPTRCSYGFGPFWKPYQDPHPPIAIAGISPNSTSIKFAGEGGYIPLSMFFNTRFLKGHWDTYSSAAEESGHKVDRSIWRVNREIFVADTDADAREFVRDSYQAEVWQKHYFEFMGGFGWLDYLKHDDFVHDSDITIDYLMDHLWIVGSPDTVRQRLDDLYGELGGFGTVLPTKYDHMGKQEQMWRSHKLLMEEVMPKLSV